LCEDEVRLEFGAGPYSNQTTVLHEHVLEERSGEPVSLSVVGIIPGCAGVQYVALEPVEHLRTTVRLQLFHVRQRRP
jgi:hypothetical protein